MPTTRLEMIRSSIADIDNELDRITNTAQLHKRNVSSGDSKRIDKLIKERRTKQDAADAEVAEELRREEQGNMLRSLGAIGAPSTTFSPTFRTSGTAVYSQNAPVSYFKDLLSSRSGDSAARERLERHGKIAGEAIRNSGRLETRAISTTGGAGGEFVPPLWLIDDYIAAVRPARATADQVTNLDLPGGTDQIDIPKIATEQRPLCRQLRTPAFPRPTSRPLLCPRRCTRSPVGRHSRTNCSSSHPSPARSTR